MIWSLIQPNAGWLLTDIPYVIGLVVVTVSPWFAGGSKPGGRSLLLFGWLLVITSFMGRFTGIICSDEIGMEAMKTIALARCVLHTFFIPLVIGFIWCVATFIFDHGVSQRRWWQTGGWLALVVFCAVWSGWLVLHVYEQFGVYPTRSPFP